MDVDHALPVLVGELDGDVDVGDDRSAGLSLLGLAHRALLPLERAIGIALHAADARVVDQDVERPADLGEHRRHARRVGDVGRDRAAAELLRRSRALAPGRGR